MNLIDRNTSFAAVPRLANSDRELKERLSRRLSAAYDEATEAFAPLERKACSNALGWSMFPDWVLDIEYLELYGQRVLRIIDGRCSLADRLASDPTALVEEFEAMATNYIQRLHTEIASFS